MPLTGREEGGKKIQKLTFVVYKCDFGLLKWLARRIACFSVNKTIILH